MHSATARMRSAVERQTLIETIRQAGVIALVALMLGWVLPVGVAVHSGVYFKKSMEHIVLSKYPAVAAQLEKYDANRRHLESLIARIDNQVASTEGTLTQVANSAPLRELYMRELQKPDPVSIQPLYMHFNLYFWPIMYFGLGVVIFLLSPNVSAGETPVREWMRALLLAIGIFAFVACPLLARTIWTITPEEGRIVFAFSNPDIDPLSFCVQLLNFAIFSLMLAVIWRRWSRLSYERKVALNVYGDRPINPEQLQMFSEVLLRWQATFMSISVGFIYYTAIFWNQIIRNRDSRFWLEAIVAHSLWLVTIGVTAMPMFLTWNDWKAAKSRAIIDLINAKADEAAGVDGKIAAIKDLEPVGKWNIAASVLTIMTSLTGPLLQAFLR